ncbi:TPA: glutathione S-transferase family protein [Burkholderia aenigmatica]|uniref:glutathione S-transferase family protein n=1 Tax=Burkholderia sp. AU45251 TaxID=3059204 RepID=UPI0004D4DE09|nr:glutathione S-transferase family protein [Burkholderia sp. AU45251]KER68669.1 glutathione S-transferase [Burkholderia cepacia]HDR9485295.1 glutathione S-transferase family protein [Burkholderia aenigmatica]MDN7515466.1 glutathione S-transferase family protein [Burkholderia sp. AU45251]HDR9516842.1 glutathione S-transferase family protein [Burkholderia aenigmatica]HDR9593902.1 glutathione S-transferase family protein [Burkholderia aenigmatica]
MKLFYYPSNASMAPHFVLEEIGKPFELEFVDRTHDQHKSPDYLALNPNGLIPVLIDGDLVLYEAAAICLHLADTHPEQRLAPELGTPERAQCYKWLMWLTNTLQTTLLAYFYPERWVDVGNAAGAAQVKAHAEAKIAALLDQLDRQLETSGGPWLLGARYTVLDPYALMLCRWTRGFAEPARQRPILGGYLQRVLARPAIQRALQTEGLAQPWV